MKLTLARARNFTRQAMKDNNIDGIVVSSKWLGKLSPYRHGPGKFRVASVVIQVGDRKVRKLVDLDDDGGARVS